ncbi:MAG: hypothetical protein QOG82_99 [Actinomycetota bacterium]|jgi:hypothetical protein|nr:hypothetical protein [Actinomycetota bacterium]
MDAVLTQATLTVAPGGVVETELRIRNTGERVDQYTYEALGTPARWMAFDRPSVSLVPGTQGSVFIRVAPPRRPGTPAGTFPFGIRVTTQGNGGSAVAEGDVEVARFDDTFAELVPRTVRGRRRAAHELAVDNRGNGTINANLKGIDPERQVQFRFKPSALVIPPGTSAFATVEVRPRRRFLRGPAVMRPYKIRLESAAQPAVDVDGGLMQEALIPSVVPKVILGLAALVVAWSVFLRPTVHSAATNAVEDNVAEASQLAASQAVAPALAQADQRLQAVEQAAGLPPGGALAAAAGGGAAGGGAGGGGATGAAAGAAGTTATTVAGQGSGLAALGDPFDRVLTPTAGLYEVPEATLLSVTDIVLQNPQADSGVLRIKRGATETLFTLNLENFRDLDYHFLAPLVFPAESELRFEVTCANVAPKTACTTALYVGGFLKKIPPPT